MPQIIPPPVIREVGSDFLLNLEDEGEEQEELEKCSECGETAETGACYFCKQD